MDTVLMEDVRIDNFRDARAVHIYSGLRVSEAI